MTLRGLTTPPETGVWGGTLNGVPVHTPAWVCENWETLERVKLRRRRTNVTIDGAAGERPYAGDVDAGETIDLWWYVTGEVDDDGVAAVDVSAQLEETLDYLAAEWFHDCDEDTGMIDADVVRPSGTVHTIGVQVDEFDAGEGVDDCRVRVRVRVPGGGVLGAIEGSA